MHTRGSRVPIAVAVLSVVTALFSAAQQRPAQISEEEIQKHFGKTPDCEVYIDSVEYFDFAGDGNEGAVVVASTCSTGTAGPDVHAVMSRQPNGSLAELKIPEASQKQQAGLFGRVFYDLNVKEGLLIETYHDQSGRDDPLVIKCRWNAQRGEFQTVEVKAAPRYKASFDCDKAKTEVENAICSSSTVGFLDLKVDEWYKSWLDKLNDANSDVLMTEQKDWLRKRNLICGNDAQIIECLETLYRARLLELEHFKYLHP